jgi:hypothetical protein
MACMFAFFTAPFNMYANAGRCATVAAVTRGAPLKRPSQARASFEATGCGPDRWGAGRRQMMALCNFSLSFSGGGGSWSLGTRRGDLNICKIVCGFGACSVDTRTEKKSVLSWWESGCRLQGWQSPDSGLHPAEPRSDSEPDKQEGPGWGDCSPEKPGRCGSSPAAGHASHAGPAVPVPPSLPSLVPPELGTL